MSATVKKQTKRNSATSSAKAGKTQGKGKQTKKKLIKKNGARKAHTSKKQPDSPVQPAHAFPVVAIGASAGGLEAMNELFDNMPGNTGMAFVVVTHQHPSHTSLLPELLGKETEMPVIEATDGLKVEPNRVYVGPPGGYLAILNSTLHRMETGATASPKLPIDYFFRSLAEDQQEKAICIVLSGTGTDGTLGLKAIKGASGMAMVEKPQSAKYAGMPASAIATNLADYVLPPAAMPQQLVAYAKGSYLKGAAVAAETPTVSAEPMQKIFVLLRNRTGHDFSSYKSSTLRRRIERRMKVHQLDDPNQYVRYLQENPHEIDNLFKEMLIGVTSFFRDPEAWVALGEALQELIKTRPDNYNFRAWIPGCSSGEEVFSIAIMLRECMDNLKRRCEVNLFGTDLDVEAIELARSSQYPDGIAVDVSPNRLERFFVREDSSYRVRREIREMSVFAPQNVIKDPPFTKLDLISCRNMLIYMNADLQKRLLPIFHYALKPGGLLFLGPSETIGSYTDLFETIDKRWKIYRRKECVSAIHVLPEIPIQSIAHEGDEAIPVPTAPLAKETRISTIIEQLLLDRFVPASIVVNDRGEIIYIQGRTGEYLEPSQGQPRHNVLEMARDGLRIELATAMRQATTHDNDVIRENVCVKSNGDFVHVTLCVTKINAPESVRGLLLVTFQPMSHAQSKPPSISSKKRNKVVVDDNAEKREREFQFLRESHQRTLEELETSNEELKSSNEELQSTNEELQSTNEELETSKEEMQSLNEELTTVNTELQSKVDDLSQANDDMQNLLNSTDIATVFLDRELNIKRFTEQSTDLIRLRRTDVGRPITELASNLEYDGLQKDCSEVLKTLVSKECEVRDKNGEVYLMRIIPYRTVDNVIDGLVLTFVNIDRTKAIEQLSREARDYFEGIVNTIHTPLLVLDDSLHVVSANCAFYQLFRLRPKQVEGELIYEIGNSEWDIDSLRELLEDILPKNTTFDNYEVNAEFRKIGHKVFLLNARRIRRTMGLPEMILLALEDITEN
ncbi:chemotaxis protein CheB [Gimesia algae]|uniref:protein-glutamate O-methyltransferase n=1 Tax=Gimesia algae TaxID=2527971 RepID=A0A517VET6_9PLAN|nr:chemotaxis protein CheB [Gimesia algae]QDT91525.1 Chemotaxis protein methyltransferase [Gimesia algae]